MGRQMLKFLRALKEKIKPANPTRRSTVIKYLMSHPFDKHTKLIPFDKYLKNIRKKHS